MTGPLATADRRPAPVMLFAWLSGSLVASVMPTHALMLL